MTNLPPAITNAISAHIKEEKNSTARYAITEMERFILLLEMNPKLVNPHSMEDIIKWFKNDIFVFKQNTIGQTS